MENFDCNHILKFKKILQMILKIAYTYFDLRYTALYICNYQKMKTV